MNRTCITLSPTTLRIWRGPLPVLGLRLRVLPPLRRVVTYTDRVATITGGAGETHVVKGIVGEGQDVVLDMLDTPEKAEYLRSLLRRGI